MEIKKIIRRLGIRNVLLTRYVNCWVQLQVGQYIEIKRTEMTYKQFHNWSHNFRQLKGNDQLIYAAYTSGDLYIVHRKK